MSTRKATIRAQRAFPAGTIVHYVDEDLKHRIGEVLSAQKGKLRVRTPPIPKRRNMRTGITPKMVRAVAHVDVVPPHSILRIERGAADA